MEFNIDIINMSIKNVKKMSRKLKKHFLNTFCHQKWGGGSCRCGLFGREPIFDPKNVKKMFLKCFFILRDSFFYIFWGFFSGPPDNFLTFSGGIGTIRNDMKYLPKPSNLTPFQNRLLSSSLYHVVISGGTGVRTARGSKPLKYEMRAWLDQRRLQTQYSDSNSTAQHGKPQYTTLHYNTLQHIRLYVIVLHHSTLHCSMLH